MPVYPRINQYKWVLILMVIGIHSLYADDLPAHLEGYCRSGILFEKWLLEYILTLAVPTFFVISGYLFFAAGIPDMRSLTEKLKRRARTLLLPYLLWNLIATLLILVKAHHSMHNLMPAYAGFEWNAASVLNCFTGYQTGYPADFVLWFIRNLLLVLCITPLLCVLLRRRPLTLLGAIFIINLIDPAWADILRSLFYFTAGACIATVDSLRRFILKTKWWAIWLALTVAMTCTSPYIMLTPLTSQLIKAGFFLNGISGVGLLIRYGLKTLSQPATISAAETGGTFFIYAMHGLYCTIVRKLALMILSPHNGFTLILCSLLSWLLLITTSYIAYRLMARFLPGATAMLTGRRS